MRRAHEGVLLRTYHAELLAAGVPSSYTWEQCWRDYRLQLWWPLVQLLTLTPTWAKQKKARTGMWAERPTDADTKLKEMYDKYHPRLVGRSPTTRGTSCSARATRAAGRARASRFAGESRHTPAETLPNFV